MVFRQWRWPRCCRRECKQIHTWDPHESQWGQCTACSRVESPVQSTYPQGAGWALGGGWHHTEGLVSRDEAHCSAAAVARSASAGGSPCTGAFAGSPRLPRGWSLQGHTVPAQFQLHTEAGQCPLDTSPRPPIVQALLVARCSLVGSGVRHEHPHALWPPHRATYYFSSRPVTFRPPSRLPTNHGASHHCSELGTSNPGHFSPRSRSTASSAAQSSVQPCKAARVGMQCSKSAFSSHTSVVSVHELGFGFLLPHSCM